MLVWRERHRKRERECGKRERRRMRGLKSKETICAYAIGKKSFIKVEIEP